MLPYLCLIPKDQVFEEDEDNIQASPQKKKKPTPVKKKSKKKKVEEDEEDGEEDEAEEEEGEGNEEPEETSNMVPDSEAIDNPYLRPVKYPQRIKSVKWKSILVESRLLQVEDNASHAGICSKQSDQCRTSANLTLRWEQPPVMERHFLGFWKPKIVKILTKRIWICWLHGGSLSDRLRLSRSTKLIPESFVEQTSG